MEVWSDLCIGLLGSNLMFTIWFSREESKEQNFRFTVVNRNKGLVEY